MLLINGKNISSYQHIQHKVTAYQFNICYECLNAELCTAERKAILYTKGHI